MGLKVAPQAPGDGLWRLQWQPVIPCILDKEVDQGPLAGLKAAFQFRPKSAWLVVACDLIDLDKGTLSQLVAARRSEMAATAFISPFDGKTEPLLAIWEASIAKPLEQAFAQGVRSARRFLQTQNTNMITALNPDALRNVNHPF